MLHTLTFRVWPVLSWSKQPILVNFANKLDIVIIVVGDVFLNIPLDWSNSSQLDVIFGAFDAVWPIQIANSLKLLHHFTGFDAAGTGEPLFRRNTNVIDCRVNLENGFPLHSADF